MSLITGVNNLGNFQPILNSNPSSSSLLLNTNMLINNNQTSSSSSSNSSTVSSSNSNNNNQTNSNTNQNRQLLNNSTIKLIQRLLDEASQTGDLLLSNKNLNEYPSKLALNYDLSDTITADLSKNHLTEFPKELCLFDSLEKLSLYSNLIRTIPEIGTYQLKCLKYLDLNSNNLSYLPPCVCNLQSLEVLTINNNKLVSLPEEIGRLDRLIQLDVSCNEITHLPIQIGDMSSLRALNVRRNLLVELPKEISQLKLVSFDCSSNRLNKLPLCFREMVTLIDLVVDHNPLEVPPAHICTKGLLHIMKYLLVEAIKEEKKRGILTEYEINTQYNNFNYNLSAHHQRLSCTAGLGSMFQNSVRNINKKLGSSSTPSSSMSTVSSTSSSSSVSSSSLTSQIPTPIFKNSKNSFVELPPPHPPPPPPPPPSSSAPPLPQSQTQFNNSNNFKLNNEIETVEYTETLTATNTSTSSPSSSTKSSCSSSSNQPIKSTIKTHKIQETPNSKIVSIHELISIKSPNSYQQQQQTTTSLNYSRSLIDHHVNTTQFDSPEQFLDNLNNHQSNRFNNSKSINSGLKNPSTNTSSKRLDNNSYDSIHKNLQIDNTTYTGAVKCQSDKRVLNNHSANIKQTQIQNQSQVNKVFVSQESIDDLNLQTKTNPSLSSSASSNQLIHDENTNQLINQTECYMDMINNDLKNYVISVDNNLHYQDSLSDEYNKYYSKNQPQGQIWIPRDDLNPNLDQESINPAFTIRRHFIQIQEEQKQVEFLKKTIETKLKIQLPSNMDEMGIALSDGVVLCHLINQIFPRAVQIIHVPSLAVPKLSLAKCRKNVENFIDACRRIGLPENDLCCAHDIIECKNTCKVARTVILLVGYNQFLQQQQQQKQQDGLNRPTSIGNIMSPSQSFQAQIPQQQTAV